MAALLYTLIVVQANSMRPGAFMPPHKRNVVTPIKSRLVPRGLEEPEHSWIALELQTIEVLLNPSDTESVPRPRRHMR